jgi:type I restriction enzyme R subunit
VDELDEDKLPELLQMRYNDVGDDLISKLGGIQKIRSVFFGLQEELYKVRAA